MKIKMSTIKPTQSGLYFCKGMKYENHRDTFYMFKDGSIITGNGVYYENITEFMKIFPNALFSKILELVKEEKKKEKLCACGHPKSEHATEYGKGFDLCRHIDGEGPKRKICQCGVFRVRK